jgi:hypothetical protein
MGMMSGNQSIFLAVETNLIRLYYNIRKHNIMGERGHKEFTRRHLIEELEEVLSSFEDDGLYAIDGLKHKIEEYKEGEKTIEILREKYVVSKEDIKNQKSPRWEL